jgi:hypothetical protein
MSGVLGRLVKGSVAGLAATVPMTADLDLHPPATRHPPRRNALMVAAHVVWGGVLGALLGGAEKDGG